MTGCRIPVHHIFVGVRGCCRFPNQLIFFQPNWHPDCSLLTYQRAQRHPNIPHRVENHQWYFGWCFSKGTFISHHQFSGDCAYTNPKQIKHIFIRNIRGKQKLVGIDDIFIYTPQKKGNPIGTSAKWQKTCLLNGRGPLILLEEFGLSPPGICKNPYDIP